MTTIGPNTLVEGRIEGGEDLTVEGRVVGTIQLSELLFVAANGTVHGTASARGVRVDGHVEGDVQASEFIHLTSTAVVRATLSAPIIRMDDGARLSGDVVMDVSAPTPLSTAAVTAARPQSVAKPAVQQNSAASARPASAPAAAATPAPKPKPQPAPVVHPPAPATPQPLETALPPVSGATTHVVIPAAPVQAVSAAHAAPAAQTTTTTVLVTDAPHKYDSMSVKELRDKLRDLDLPVSGTKQDLMERLAEAES